MKVVIIGTGNVATVLGKKIIDAGHEIIQAAGRNFERTNLLASQLHCNAIYNLRYISMLADIYIISVSDSAIHTVAAELRLKDRIIVHTAAAVSKDVLAVSSENYGVLYPLQTLTKDNSFIPSIPMLIDANNEATKKTLTDFATDWAESLQIATDTERLKLHVAAIFLNNFTNYIFTLLEEYLKKEGLKFNVLYPLIEETIKGIKINSPATLQTGPAIRNDFATIEKHKEILEGYPKLKILYNDLTDSISAYYNRNTA